MNIALIDAVSGGHHEEYASLVARYLLACGDEVTLLTSAAAAGAQPLRELAPDLRLMPVLASPGSNGWIRARRMIRRTRALNDVMRRPEVLDADVVHDLYLDGSELAWCGTRSRGSRATLATLFGLRHVPDAGRTAESLKRRVRGRVLRETVGRGKLHCLFIHSSRIRDALREGVGIDSSALAVIPDPAPPSNHIPTRVARRRLGLPENVPTLLFFGKLRHDKGPDLLLRALHHVTAECCVVIAGEPLSFSVGELHSLQEGVRSSSRVVLRLRAVPAHEVDDYFAAADAVVLPYRKSFAGTSGVLMHAAAAGKPVVAAAVGDVRTAVQNNKLGILVHPESVLALARGIETFLEASDSFERLVSPWARAYAAENSADVFGAAIRASYVRVLDRLAGG